MSATTGVWTCSIGRANQDALPPGSDAPMRLAVQEAYFRLTGEDADFTFSGWDGQLTDAQKQVLVEATDQWLHRQADRFG